MSAISAELLAVVVAMVGGEPAVLVASDDARLPAGPLLPGQSSLQSATRAWVEAQTGLKLGFLEQLYTFQNLTSSCPEVSCGEVEHGDRTLSVSYLGLTTPASGSGVWLPCYEFFPWEDLRKSRELVLDVVAPVLDAWVEQDALQRRVRRSRADVTFGLNGKPWLADWVLQRYELLYEVGAVPESPAEGRLPQTVPGRRMLGDHRRVLATGLARLRAKIQYRPVVFELLPETFTLRQLQACVEALSGMAVHTQNFRRLVEGEELVEETGESTSTGGRPARLFRFRREVMVERQAAGTKLPAPRSR
ncbi:MAG: hypothetical protein LBR21_03650 [Propionibacteriaceae bacterium]|jgi:hypothetical protein|nr:hypothetical protein [Propionibacteriaceae bacterium]